MTAPHAVWVVGAGGHAKVVLDTLRAAGYTVAGILDDDKARHGTDVLGAQVVAGSAPEELTRLDVRRAVVGIGDNAVRARLVALLAAHVAWASAIHPAAVVAPSAEVHEGSVLVANAVVQADTVLGSHAIVNTAATIDHDCVIGPCVHVAPGAHLAGGVTVGEGALIGLGASVVPGITVGAWATVGAGAVVIRDVPDHATVKGVPARS